MRSGLALLLGFCLFAAWRPDAPRGHSGPASITVDSAVAHASFDGARLFSLPAMASFAAPMLPPVELPRADLPVTPSTPVYLRQLVLLL